MATATILQAAGLVGIATGPGGSTAFGSTVEGVSHGNIGWAADCTMRGAHYESGMALTAWMG